MIQQKRPSKAQVFRQNFERNLYRVTGAEQEDDILNVLNADLGANTSSSTTITSDSIGGGAELSTTMNQAGTPQPASSSGSGLEAQIAPGANIQQAMDAINAAGGGVLFLSEGTYAVGNALNGYSNIEIVGEDMTTTFLNFGAAANGIAYAGTNIYTTGTITSITSGVNVTGSGTSWTTAMAGQNLFLGTRWYLIAAVTSGTTLILAEAYGDNISFPGASYRIATVITGVVLKDLTIQASTTTALSFTDAKDIEMTRLTFIDNNVGIAMTNASRVTYDQIVVAESTSDGVQLTNCGLCDGTAWLSAGNGGNGFTLSNTKTIPFLFCSSTANTGDGYNCTTVFDTVFKTEASSNGGAGIQFVSGCQNCFVNDSLVRGNTGDGIKLTASTSYCTFGASLSLIGNGGWGINIANANDLSNTIVVPYFSSNTSGTVQDLGTGTNTVTTVNNTVLQQTFTASSSVSAGNALTIGNGASGYLTASNQQGASVFHIYITAGNTKTPAGQTFVTSARTTAIRAVLAKFNGNGGNATNVTASIYATSANVPTGSALGTVTEAESGANGQVITFTFATPVPVSASTQYAVTFSTSGTGLGDNLDILYNAAGYNSQYMVTESVSTWTAIGNQALWHAVWEVESVAGEVQPTDTTQTIFSTDSYDLANTFLGFALTSASAGAPVSVIMLGISNVQSGLTTATTYYLNGTGGAIGTSAGSVSVKVGFAISSTGLFIKGNNYP